MKKIISIISTILALAKAPVAPIIVPTGIYVGAGCIS